MVGTKINFGVSHPPAPACEQGSPSADGWHVVQVMTGKEQKVMDDLKLDGWLAYCPMETRWRKPRGGKQENDVALSRRLEARRVALNNAQAIRVPEARERALAALQRALPKIRVGKDSAIERRTALIPGYLFVHVGRERDVNALIPSRHNRGVEGVVSVVFAPVAGSVQAVRLAGRIEELMQAETRGDFDGTRKKSRDMTAVILAGQRVALKSDFTEEKFIARVQSASRQDRISVILEGTGLRVVTTAEKLEAMG